MNLLIFNLEGVLGDIFIPYLFDPNSVAGLYFRQGMIKAMRMLSEKF